MGVVLAATHLGLDETVAIKFMRPEVQNMPGTLSRFAKEAKIAARIRSEHVAKVLDVGVAEPIGPYIVMEYLEGRSLGELVDQDGPLPVARAVEYMLQACEALAAAHSIGVTHRDIKPDNFFLTLHGGIEVLKLLDFGISKATLTGRVFGDDLALSATSFVMGTPLYMSPEQIRSLPDVDTRTDIWSMGAVLYELISGKTAFTAAGVTEICAMILERPAPSLGEPCSAALRPVEAIIQRCLEKDPARRFQTVADLAAALLPLAPQRARAYADRSSCILRASSLALNVPAPSDAPPESGIRAPQQGRAAMASGSVQEDGVASPTEAPGAQLGSVPLAAARQPERAPRKSVRWPALVLVGLAIVGIGRSIHTPVTAEPLRGSQPVAAVAAQEGPEAPTPASAAVPAGPDALAVGVPDETLATPASVEAAMSINSVAEPLASMGLDAPGPPSPTGAEATGASRDADLQASTPGNKSSAKKARKARAERASDGVATPVATGEGTQTARRIRLVEERTRIPLVTDPAAAEAGGRRSVRQ